MSKSRLLAFALVLLAAFGAVAQEETTTTTTAAAATTTAATAPDSRRTREELREVLGRLPPEVSKVLKLDPTLWANAEYLKHYPALAAFVAEHPEVTHSPQFFLEGVWIPGDPSPESASMSFWRDMVQGVMVFAFLVTGTFVLAWLIRMLVEQRRWSRISRVQTEVHSKLLDRFASNEELLAYIQTPGGKRFLESSPIVPSTAAPVSAPIGRILWSVQVGLVLAAGGAGLQLVSWSLEKEAAQALSGVGVLAIAVGIGFVVSAAASYLLSRRLGLWAPAPRPADETGT